MLPDHNYPPSTYSQQQPSQFTNSLSSSPTQSQLQELCSLIMTSNSIEKVTAYENLLSSYESLIKVLPHLCSSKQIYFVTSQVLLRILKSKSQILRLKLTDSFSMLNHSFNFQEFKNRSVQMYVLIQNKYLEIISQNFSSLQKHQRNQALEIVSHTLSELFNLCAENQQPHIGFIALLFPGYMEWKKMTGFSVLSFITEYEPFSRLAEKDVIFPENVEMYRVLLNIMSSVIEMKQTWEQEKHTFSIFSSNHRMFKNRHMQDWAEFAVQQAKIVFNLYLNQEKVLFSHIVLEDVIKLLHQVLLFDYETMSQKTYEGQKDKFVKSPEYSFPEGILKLIAEDHTFLEVMHQIHDKVTTLSQLPNNNTFQTNSQQQTTEHILSQSKVIQISEKILQIYGRMFFATTQSQKYNHNETLVMESLVETQQVPSYLNLHLTKVSILSEILTNPNQFLCNNKSQSQGNFAKQRYSLYYGAVQIVSQFIIYSRCIEDPNPLSMHFPSSQLKSQIRQKMKRFLVEVINFAHDHCLQQECWSIMFGDGEEIENDEIFTDLRHSEIFFPHKVLDMLYQLHLSIDAKFLNPLTEIDAIRQFYVKYFQIADEFLGRLETEFTNKISQLILTDFNLQYSMMREFFRHLPYVKIKENKTLEMPVQYKPHNCNYIQQSYESKQKCERQIVLDYFQKFDEIITNIGNAIYAKVQLSTETKTLQNLSFFYYLISVLVEHYLANSSFYTKASEPLIRTIKLLLKIAFEGNHANSAPSVFAFYEQVVAILSEKSFNSKELLEIIFETEEQALSMKLLGMGITQSTQEEREFYDMKNKLTTQRSLDLVKKLMKSTCQRLITSDIKELDAALIVLKKIFRLFYRNAFVEEFGFLKEFIQNYMNSAESLFASKKHLSRKTKLIELTIEFMQIKENKFSRMQISQFIISLNNAFIAPFLREKSIQTLLSYFACIERMIKTIIAEKLFVIDVFLCSIQSFIHDINKNYRKLVSSNVNFYQTTKSLLYTILDVIDILGGQTWGVKACDNSSENRSQNSEYEGWLVQDDRKIETGDFKWEENKRDNELPLIVEEYFYTWVKQLGREEYETQNYSTMTKEQQQANNQDIVLIYSMFIHLTPNGKLPPLPKVLAQKQRTTHLCTQLQKSIKLTDELIQKDPTDKETQTTNNLIKLYLDHIYRLSSTNLMAIYPSIDYRLEYVKKWWEEIMVRGMKPEINVSLVYSKFIKYGGQKKNRDKANQQLAQFIFKIANYYKEDHQYIKKILDQHYRVRSMVVAGSSVASLSSETPIQGMMLGNEAFNNPTASFTIYEESKQYAKRLIELWMYNN